MYTTVKSVPSIWADAVDVEPGLTGPQIVPVLCCPAVAGIVSSVVTAVGETLSNNDSGDTAVLQTTYAAAYIAPGRIVRNDVTVRDDASVDELVSAARRRA